MFHIPNYFCSHSLLQIGIGTSEEYSFDYVITVSYSNKYSHFIPSYQFLSKHLNNVLHNYKIKVVILT